MTADDVYGHTYIDSNGARHKKEPKHWTIRYYYIENEGWGFMRRGAERKTNITINPKAELSEVSKLSKIIKSKLEENISVELEKMVSKNKRSSTIYD